MNFTEFAFDWSSEQLLNTEFDSLHLAFLTRSYSQTFHGRGAELGAACMSVLWEQGSYPFPSRYMDKEKILQIDFYVTT